MDKRTRLPLCLLRGYSFSLQDLPNRNGERDFAIHPLNKNLLNFKQFVNSPPMEGWQAKPDGVVKKKVVHSLKGNVTAFLL